MPENPVSAPKSQQGPPSRAGRNLPLAIAVGVGLAALVLVSLLNPAAFTILVAVALGIAAWDLHSIGQCRRARAAVADPDRWHGDVRRRVRRRR